MKIKILGTELNYSTQEIGSLSDGHFAKVLIEDYFEYEIASEGNVPKKILRKTSTTLQIPITRETFKELWRNMDLKTLKGIEFEVDFKMAKEDLRQEAIKWLKEMNKADEDSKNAFKTSDGSEPFKANEHAYDDTEDWIMHFFNIKEEDLQWKLKK